MRNFARINNHANKLQAWEDWRKLAALYPEAAKLYEPPAGAGWRKVDACIAMLRTRLEVMEEQQHLETGDPS